MYKAFFNFGGDLLHNLGNLMIIDDEKDMEQYNTDVANLMYIRAAESTNFKRLQCRLRPENINTDSNSDSASTSA